MYEQLAAAREAAERHLRDAAQIEFTVDRGRLFVTELRAARIEGKGRLSTQLQLMCEGVLSPSELLGRITPADVEAWIRPAILDKSHLVLLGRGLPLGLGSASGGLWFLPDESGEGRMPEQSAILVVRDLPSCSISSWVEGATGVLALQGGRSGHAGIVCRWLSKPCVSGFSDATIDTEKRMLTIPDHPSLHEGDWVTFDGDTGEVYAGSAPVGVRPWQSQPELECLAAVVERAVSSGNVSAASAGGTWRLWDFFHHGVPVARMQRDPRHGLRVHRRHIFGGEDPTRVRTLLTPIPTQSQRCIRDVLVGLITTLHRLLDTNPKTRNPGCRWLWHPNRTLEPRPSSQLIGLEFTEVDRAVRHLPEIGKLRLVVDCRLESPSEAWGINTPWEIGLQASLASTSFAGCHVTVNGALLKIEDLPTFYTWMRRREYFGSGPEPQLGTGHWKPIPGVDGH